MSSSAHADPGSSAGVFQPAPELCRAELLHELFERSADLQPGQIALACREERMTYGELEARANQLARYLRKRGVGRGMTVGLLLPRSLDVLVGLLGALKAGAAYVPLDADYPPERIQFILEDCGVTAVVSVTALAPKLGSIAARAVWLDAQAQEIVAESDARITRQETGTTPEDVGYVIYTSGSTGRPKGVQIEHRSVCHLVRAEGAIFQVRPEDRVYQGFSIAFDASVEEVWLAFFARATLVVGTREMVFSGPGLSQQLADAGITVFSTVPTQLAMMTDDVASVRLLILGGEVCPPDLVRRWARPGRRLINTYGPTEATVIATWVELQPGQPVTIGRPVPNYHVCLLDESLRPVPAGQPGELCIGGIGLARGYVGREDLTRERFILHPGARADPEPPRLYRTGDLARFTAAGELEFLGRLDSQVKLRGYRIELSEIESALLSCPGVGAAAVAVREDLPGVPQLGGYIVPAPDRLPVEAELKRALGARLPGYMVPAFIEVVDRLPMLPSGKVDRRALPAPRPRPRPAEEDSDAVAPRTPLEQKLATVWERFFAPQRVSVKADFFHDLGGHSLLAARVVSALRQDDELRRVSILDLYENPTVEALAAKLGADGCARAEAPDPTPPPASGSTPRIPWLRHFLCGSGQFVSLYFLLGLFSMQWLAPYFTYAWTYEQGYERWEAILGAFGVLVALFPLMLLASIVIKWLVIGRYRAGDYPLWGFYYFRFWLVKTIQSAVPVTYLAGTPWLNLYYRLLGARLGRDVHLASPCFVCPDLVDVGDETCVGTDASLAGFHVENGRLIIGRVRIGRGCLVGSRAVIRENAALEDGSILEELSFLPAGKTIPAGERWLGSPSRRVAAPPGVEPVLPPRPGAARRFLFGLLHLLGVILFPACVLAAILPGVVVMNTLNYADDYYWYLLMSPLIALSFVVFLCLEIAALKWLLLGRVQPGRYSTQSWFYVRKWFVDQLLELSLDVLGPLYASIYLAPWYRLLGARLGERTEISTASFISPDLLEVGDESFIADSVSLGAARLEKGHILIGVNRIGTRTFIGNSALLPPGVVVGNHALIGCLSTPPANPADAARDGATWLGSPAMFLPQRQPSTAFSVESTFRPTPKLQAQRAAIEFLRVIFPVTGFVMLSSLLFSMVVWLEPQRSLVEVLLLFPLLYAGAGLLAIGFLAAAKWLLVGRYQPGERPLWSTFVWRNELINALHEHLVSDFIVEMLPGTPFLSWFFRLLGARIGRRVYLDTSDLTEFDLVSIGDEAEINADATLQTHLFEDRVMKMSHVEIGARCTVGSASLVLYDTRMEPGAQLNDLSLLMKGETLPAETLWEGIPARPPAPC